jgi:Flp pilus assembly pilin Flp
MRAILRRLRRDESGISMTELLVASVLTVMVMAMIGTMFVQVTRITKTSNDTQIYNGLASNAANELSAVLRVATTIAKANVATPDPAIVYGTRSTLRIYSLSNLTPAHPGPVMVTFSLDAVAGTNPVEYRITETRCEGTASAGYWTFGTCATTTTRSFGKGILPATGVSDQLFTYLDVNGDPILIGTGSLQTTPIDQRPLVAAIKITIRVQTAGSPTGAVLVSNTVVLRNLGLDTGT